MSDGEVESSGVLSRSFGLLSLHSAGLTAIAGLLKLTNVQDYFNVKLAVGFFLFGAICAILQMYYAAVDDRKFFYRLGFESDPDDGPSTKGVPPDQLKWQIEDAARRREQTRTRVAVLNLVVAGLLAGAMPIVIGRVWHTASSATNLLVGWSLIAVVAAPVSIVAFARRDRFWLHFGRGTLALLSLLAFVLGLGLAAVPTITKNIADGAAAAATAPNTVATQGKAGADGQRGATGERGSAGEKGPAGDRGEKGEPGPQGRDGRDGKDGLDGKDGRSGRDAARLLEPPSPAPPAIIPVVKGEKGDRGESGSAGSPGAPGAKGDPGPVRRCWLGRFYCSPEPPKN
jgi:hypothetical protein